MPTERVELLASDASFRGAWRELIAPFSLELRAAEVWGILGANGSGKSLLAQLLAGEIEPHAGTISGPARDAGSVSIVSFERQERVMARERREDVSSIMHGRLDPGRTVREFIVGDGLSDELVTALGIDHILDRGLRFLSTGEFRKALVARAIAENPSVLILDDPYDGLDARSRDELAALIDRLADQRFGPARCIVLAIGRERDLPASTTHVLVLEDGAVVSSGTVEAWRALSPGFRETTRPRPPRDVPASPPTAPVSGASGPRASAVPIIRLESVSVSYEQTRVLTDITWSVREGERWIVHGPNGSGKSTLLSLISGDNTKGYGQHVELFGRAKGSGESVWEIKRRIGFVSGGLQFDYPLRPTALEAVVSGFHDSLGLYEAASGHEEELAREWLARIGLSGVESKRLRELSFGVRRLVLIARAVVKRPQLLIADEPCQGLDDAHTARVLELLDAIGEQESTTLLYVTHVPEERLRCLTHDLELVPGPEGSRAVVSALG